jgi:hypothetical protein
MPTTAAFQPSGPPLAFDASVSTSLAYAAANANANQLRVANDTYEWAYILWSLGSSVASAVNYKIVMAPQSVEIFSPDTRFDHVSAFNPGGEGTVWFNRGSGL